MSLQAGGGRRSADPLGETQYRRGAQARLAESDLLLTSELFAGAAYLAGRGVEGMLRALIWRHDADIRKGNKSLDVGHDLHRLLQRVQRLGVLSQSASDDRLAGQVQRVGRLWFNNMRFAPLSYIEKRWRVLGIVGRNVTMKQASRQFFDDCSNIIRRCEALCQRSSFRSS